MTEIERLQDAKRRALAIADERAKEANELRAERDALVKALQLQEAAEEAHANCDECNGEDVPELCPICFPLFDDARIARRGILAAVSGAGSSGDV
jgi:hypothetical protein